MGNQGQPVSLRQNLAFLGVFNIYVEAFIPGV